MMKHTLDYNTKVRLQNRVFDSKKGGVGVYKSGNF